MAVLFLLGLQVEKKGDGIMENKVYVMTAKQAAKAFPLNEELYARLKVLEDSGFEPDFDDEHPDLPDDAIIVKSDINIFDSIFKKLRNRLKMRKKETGLA
ncbi:MAG: hypothetical protein LBC75_03680 [Fibromonadaceae bacterium]|jgi:hypothetical protein|nr:hypothetical protein [Fibromonadaceae bacterium]